VADCLIDDCRDRTFDLVVLPGGMPGAEHLRDHDILTQILNRQQDEKRLIAAICAAPAVVFAHHGLLNGRQATAHPAFVEMLPDAGSAEAPVVVDGNCVTSRGPGTAMAFALELVAMLFGESVRKAVADPMVIVS
jgi:4-methyl-5(b-hydroxyethyl)-thiazole monophosphate biosynthesis